jgi:HipA-like protein
MHARHVTQKDDQGLMAFHHYEKWLGSAGAVPLSHSLPLKAGKLNRNACRGFLRVFCRARANVKSLHLGISARNDFAMLEHRQVH